MAVRSGGSEWRMSGEMEVVMGREKKIRSLNCLLRVPSLGNGTMDTDILVLMWWHRRACTYLCDNRYVCQVGFRAAVCSCPLCATLRVGTSTDLIYHANQPSSSVHT